MRMSVSQSCSDLTLAARSPGHTSPQGGLQRGAASPLWRVARERTANCTFVVCPPPLHSFSALRHRVQTSLGHGRAGEWPCCLAAGPDLFDHGVSWQPGGVNFTRASGQTEPSSSLLLSCSVFQDFCDLKPKVGQRQAAPGQYLNWVSINRGKSCSLADEVVSFSQDLLQCTLPWVWIWHSTCGVLGQRGSSGGAVLAVKPVSGSNPPAVAVLGCREGS